MPIVLAVDPGNLKCGVAVVGDQGVIAREICPTLNLVERVKALLDRTGADRLIVGGGTNGRKLAKILKQKINCPVPEIVDESHTTLLAKKVYYQQNPPQGLKRLIPGGLLTPKEPIDDYVAVILAERALGLNPGE